MGDVLVGVAGVVALRQRRNKRDLQERVGIKLGKQKKRILRGMPQ